MILPYTHVWNTVTTPELVSQVDTWNRIQISLECIVLSNLPSLRSVSCLFLGWRISNIVFTFLGSGFNPTFVTIFLKYSTSGTLKLYFLEVELNIAVLSSF